MALVGSTLDGLCPYVDDTTIIEQALRCACKEVKDAVYNELWHACAGPYVNIPVVGQKVFYFPQGHLEQVQAHTNQDSTSDLPAYKLPFNICCTVIHVQFKVEKDTDEVYAQVTLLPESNKKKYTLPQGILPALPQRTEVKFFSKPVTTSDTSTHGGLSVLRKHAEVCFPPLDTNVPMPAQEFLAKDLHGYEWGFRHIYRGMPKRHLLTSGWSIFVSAKKIQPGDSFIFLRAKSGEYRVGVRRSKNSRCGTTMSILTSRSMQLGVLATAYHALTTGTMFSVYYRPRTSPAEFIIPCDQYMNSLKPSFSIGMMFRYKLDDEDCSEGSLIGTITGIGEIDPIRWPGSSWRCLQARWKMPCAVARPERISPWKLEPLAITNKSPVPCLNLSKRPRTPRYVSPALANPGTVSLKGVIESAAPPQGRQGISQGQEKSGIGTQGTGNEGELSFSQWISLSSSESIKSQRRRLEYCQPPQLRIQDPSSSNMVPTSNGSPANTLLKLGSLYLPSFPPCGTNCDIGLTRNHSKPNMLVHNSSPVTHDPSSSNMVPTSNGSPTNLLKLGSLYLPSFPPSGTSGDLRLTGNHSKPSIIVHKSSALTPRNINPICMLFGVDILKNPTATTPPSAISATAPPSAISATTPPSAISSTAPPSAISSTAPPSAISSTAPPSAISSTAPPSAISATNNRESCNVPLATLQSGSFELDKLSKKTNGSNSSGSGSGSVLSSQHCIKVHKHGTAFGRIVDLLKFNGYEELMRELDQMFEFKGELLIKNGYWRVVYKDREGDTMLVGDSSWGEFQTMVRKLFICPREEIHNV